MDGLLPCLCYIWTFKVVSTTSPIHSITHTDMYYAKVLSNILAHTLINASRATRRSVPFPRMCQHVDRRSWKLIHQQSDWYTTHLIPPSTCFHSLQPNFSLASPCKQKVWTAGACGWHHTDPKREFFFTSVQSSLKSELMPHMKRQDEQVKAFLWTFLWSNYEIITLN